MGQVLLLLVVALTVAAVVFGVTVLVTGRDPGLAPAEPDGRAVPLPGARPLRESDVGEVRFDTALRGYRMAQVDQAMRRAAYDIGYKSELIGVLEAEVAALREGRTADADALRAARDRSAGATAAGTPDSTSDVAPVDVTGGTEGTDASSTSGRTDAPAPPGDTDAPSTTGALHPVSGTAGDDIPAAGRPDRDDDVPVEAGDPADPVDEAGQRRPAVRSESA
ncbi:DivIVA domain-containing protein [Micromonospora sp. NPDC049799]|uniref:DivIVA domain-containing protein n=1 Tax=Micromonospora sp. NPDC049799 TaxID=3154741 RepID=UPI0033EF2AD3